ncbi:MAG: tetratricopeptide repeat protein, partial [Planctomycetota bacterium]
MLFELRNSVPEVSDQWVEARDLFLSGKVRSAWEISKELRGKNTIRQADDFILNIEIARACGILKPYLALVRLAHRQFPNDPIVQLYYSRMLQTRMRQVTGIIYLHSVEDSLGKTHRGWWGTQLANLYADAGFAASCNKWMQLMKDEPLFDSPFALYARSCAEDGQRNWDAAIELAKQCVESAPKWTRARAHLTHCLLARGRVEEAQQQYKIVRDLGMEEAYIDTSSALVHCALGNFEQSAEELKQCVKNWPESEAMPWTRRMLYVLHVENGRYDEARKIAESDARETRAQNKLGLPSIDEVELDQPHKFIPIPLVAQNRNQCVPTTVAMATYPQGRRLDANALYQEMHGRNGTPLWRVREWANNNNATFVPIRLEIPAIKGLLDRGIPLIGILEGPFNSHVDVVSGYHDGLKVFYVRDPAHWGAMVIPYDMCLERYALDDGVMALIDNDDQDSIDFANQHRSDGLSALLDLQQAAAQGDRESAETAAARIDDDSILAYQRDVWGNAVTISHKQYAERMEALAKDQDANGTARFRAMMSLDAEVAKPIFEQLLDTESEKIGPHGELYVRMLSHYRQGNWEIAHKLLERCLLRGSGVAELWSMKCDLLNELGRQDQSKRALELAQELAPENLMLTEKALGVQWNHLTYEEYESRIETLIANHPDERRILWGRVNVRREGPDGFAYESALRDHLRWFPRDMTAYSSLGYWFAVQGRGDLAHAVMDEAEALMPENFEDDSPSDKDEKESKPKVTAETPLPENTPELLDILWETEDPRRDKAIRRLMSRKSAGQLKWAEHSQFTAVEIGYGLHGEPAKTDEVRR